MRALYIFLAIFNFIGAALNFTAFVVAENGTSLVIGSLNLIAGLLMAFFAFSDD